MAVVKYGIKMNGIKRASRLTKSLRDGWYASIYYNLRTNDIDVFQHHIDEGAMPDGMWEDVDVILVDHTFLPMTMKQIADVVADAIVRREKD